jgi:predicted Zn-dependent protease
VWADIEDGIDRSGATRAGAQQAFDARAAARPGNGLAMKYLADISFRAGSCARHATGYRRAIAARFRHPDAFVNLGAIAEREGRLDEARAALTEAVQI